MAYIHDENNDQTCIRDGDGIGGYLDLADLTAGSWQRLMWAADNGSLVTGKTDQINIGTLRSDILEIDNWILKILNDGYYSRNKIVSYENGVATLAKPVNFNSALRNASIEFVVYPVIVNPFAINYSSDASANLEIAITAEDVYTPTRYVKIEELAAGETTKQYFSNIDHIFYRFATNTTGALSFGEHHKE